MNNLASKIQSLSEKYWENTRDVRRHIHRNPELSFKEHETSSYILKELNSYGIENAKIISNTGVVFDLVGDQPGPLIALRADIDALPIKEENQTDYRSEIEGVMHACGHDVHTASLLGAARILNQLKDQLPGTIRFIFQPGEEKLPGGASLLIKEGVLEDPKPSTILGQHVMPLLPVGKIGFRKGEYMASADEIYLTVKGKGGHAAMPERNIDPVLITSHIITALQQVVSRNANPKMPSVLSFGKVIANGATNVIPEQVLLEGTFRTFNEEWRFEAHKKIKSICNGIASAMGGECDIDIRVGYPFLSNNEEYTKRNIKRAEAYMGKENVIELDRWMAAEDFAFYSHQVDACFYRLGTRNEELGITSNVHTSTFDIDENAIKYGMGLISYLAASELIEQ